VKRTFVVCLILGCFSLAAAQDLPARLGNSVNVQRLFKFSGTLSDRERGGFGGMVSVRFMMYDEPYGGEEYWQETQNVRPDALGRYSVLLGEATPGGLPADIFRSGVRWLAVQAGGQPEQARVLLVGVPSAAKSDAKSSSASVSQSAIPANATERLLTVLLSICFLVGIGLTCMEVRNWWRKRTAQYGPPPFADLLSSMPSREQLRRAAQVFWFPVSDRFRGVRGRLLRSARGMGTGIEEENRPEKAA
jgi:hypothetical protein